jgi:hypothetical protein
VLIELLVAAFCRLKTYKHLLLPVFYVRGWGLLFTVYSTCLVFLSLTPRAPRPSLSSLSSVG